MLKYLEFQRLCDTTFFLFLVSWPYTRHYLYNLLLISVYFDLPVILHRDNRNNPTYQIMPRKGGGSWGAGYYWNPQQGYYFTYEVHMAFIALLATLQAILLLWFAMIIRLAIRVVRGTHAEDDRSDDEDDEDTVGDEDNKNIASLSVGNGNIIPFTNGIAYSNGIHQRKMAG
jgi:very-long-chain ceramide synthase